MTSRPDPQDEAPVPGLKDLDLSQLPSRDLWPDIAPRLRPRRRRAWIGWAGYAMAASVTAVVALGLLRGMPATSVSTTASLEADGADTGFSAPSSELLAAAPSENRALIKANLKIVTSAERQLRHALELDPESAALQRQLVRVQAQRRELKQMMAPRAETGV
ncbi:MAG TPA: hypothetical protein VGE57_10200 [Solimonas sp.]